MIPDSDLVENGFLIVTGSTLRAERKDRPLAYKLKSYIEEYLERQGCEHCVLVLSDLWYLNTETLHSLPMISIGGTALNAVSANLYRRLHNLLVIDDTLIIQMDPNLEDLRVCLWGSNYLFTEDVLEIFINNGYLERFLDAAVARSY